MHETGETALFGIPGVQAQRGRSRRLVGGTEDRGPRQLHGRADSRGAAVVHGGGPRANEKGATVLVHTDNLAARIDNAVRDTLAKALGGG